MAVELPYTVAWTRTALTDGSGRHLVDWTVTDNASNVVGHFQKIYQPTDPDILASQDMRSSAQQLRFKNVQIQDMPASGSFTLNSADLAWPIPS